MPLFLDPDRSECDVCLNNYDDKEFRPVVFTCGHSLCLQCSKLVKSSCHMCRISYKKDRTVNLRVDFVPESRALRERITLSQKAISELTEEHEKVKKYLEQAQSNRHESDILISQLVEQQDQLARSNASLRLETLESTKLAEALSIQRDALEQELRSYKTDDIELHIRPPGEHHDICDARDIVVAPALSSRMSEELKSPIPDHPRPNPSPRPSKISSVRRNLARRPTGASRISIVFSTLRRTAA